MNIRYTPANLPCLRSSCVTAFMFGLIYTLYPAADASVRYIPLSGKLQNCYRKVPDFSKSGYVGALYTWHCEAGYSSLPPKTDYPMNTSYIQSLLDLVKKESSYTRKKRQAGCVRREIRALSDAERTRFLNAVVALKSDTSVTPNKFDALAMLHQGTISLNRAHGGPGFSGWHRYFLRLFETALRQIDNRICLPYWDSSLDGRLSNPRQSVLWGPNFLGNGNGQVVNGPFANWAVPDNGFLTRNIGGGGTLYTDAAVNRAVQCRNYNIMLSVSPTFEIDHGGPHNWIGGQMRILSFAAFEPAFWLHHCFVDYLFQRCRENLVRLGLNPSTYPDHPQNEPEHQSTSPMGFDNLLQRDGYQEAARQGYSYEASPTCPSCGNSPYLRCRSGRCVSATLQSTALVKRAADPEESAACPDDQPEAYQNTYCIDGVCDINRWAFIQVKIFTRRPPEFRNYGSYPVYNGVINRKSDIYQPTNNSELYRYVQQEDPAPAKYEDCEVTSNGIGRVFVISKGYDYDGWYIESAIVDQRPATSFAIAYVAVKNPKISGKSQVLLRANDKCGRICAPACKVPGSKPTRYRKCSGLIEIDTKSPLMYSTTYDNAVLDVFGYKADPACPSENTADIFVAFFCNYSNELPLFE